MITVLLKALYYEVMNNRRNQILSATKETCEWIWTSEFANFLADPAVKAFWITGKPGSGKSTLMKYLASSLHELVRALPRTWKYKDPDAVDEVRNEQITWTTVNFFFDFRMTTKVGNSLEGLLRTLLYQFAKALPHLIRHFAPDPTQYRDFSLDQLRAALDRALISLNDSRTHILILVDGLDEFAGKARGILDFLLMLSKNENVKICMASRPESMIRERLSHVQSLSVSNHNGPGISHFIDDAISEFKPRLDALKLTSIRSVILAKALGVFLWVYYAVEETLQAYVEGATVDEIKVLIMELPDELEAIYSRIVENVPSARKSEAAILYTLISAADFNVSLELLHSSLYLLVKNFGVQVVDVEDLHHFSRRLHATMGGLVDVVTVRASEDSDTPPYVRLMHETVKSFTIKSQWVTSYLPPEMWDFPAEDVWFRLGSQALAVVTPMEALEVNHMLLHMYERDAANIPDGDNGQGLRHSIPAIPSLSYGNSTQFLTQSTQQQHLTRLISILHHSIIFLPPICARLMKSSNIHHELRQTCEQIFQSKLIAWHFALARCLETYSDVDIHFYEIAGSATLLMHYEVQDLLLASAYRVYGYLEERMDRIAMLEDRQRDEVVGVITASSLRWPQRGQREWIKGNGWYAGPVRELVDRILCRLIIPSSFHILIYLVLGYTDIPKYMRRIQQNVANAPIRTWPDPQLPTWASNFDAAEGGRLETWFPRHSPSYSWKVEARNHGLGIFTQEQSILFGDLGIQMIDTSVEQPLTVSPSLLEKVLHPESVRSYLAAYPSASKLFNAIGRRLYQLEARGAPFPDSPMTLIDLDWALFENRAIFHALTMLQDLLFHRMSEGHLPQPLHTENNHCPQRFCNICAGYFTSTDYEAFYATFRDRYIRLSLQEIGAGTEDAFFSCASRHGSELTPGETIHLEASSSIYVQLVLDTFFSDMMNVDRFDEPKSRLPDDFHDFLAQSQWSNPGFPPWWVDVARIHYKPMWEHFDIETELFLRWRSNLQGSLSWDESSRAGSQESHPASLPYPDAPADGGDLNLDTHMEMRTNSLSSRAESSRAGSQEFHPAQLLYSDVLSNSGDSHELKILNSHKEQTTSRPRLRTWSRFKTLIRDGLRPEV